MCDLNKFVNDNSTFILTFSALISSCVGGCLLCILKSRCTRIKFGCFSCERTVITETELPNVTISNATLP